MEGQQLLLVVGDSVEDLTVAISRLRDTGSRSFLVLACEGDNWDTVILARWLNTMDEPVFGGIFPSIIHLGRCHLQGTLIIGFPGRAEIAVVNRLSDRGGVEPQLLALAPVLEGSQSLLVLFDGLCPNLEAFVEGLYAVAGVRTVVVGGGAGYLDLVQRPCLLTNAGVLEDSALIVSLPSAIDRGMAHGWQRLSGPFLVTRSQGSVLDELNYQSAFEVYRKEVETHADQRFSDAEFFSISKTFPLGIEGLDDEFLVRDPIKRAGGALVCVGEVPQNSTVYLLKGEAASLIASAGEAAAIARAERIRRRDGRTAGASVALVFDCVTRVLFLGEAFDQELAAIDAALADCGGMCGALTLGEIASSRGGVIELMNKSTLVALIETIPQS